MSSTKKVAGKLPAKPATASAKPSPNVKVAVKASPSKVAPKAKAGTLIKGNKAKCSTLVDPVKQQAAIKIQAAVRGYLTRKRIRRDAERKVAMDAEMEQLRQQAWLAEVALERRQEAKAKQKAEEASKRKREEAKIRKELLEAAFDDDVGALKALLQAGADLIPDIVDTADAHGNTCLSEAAAGGAAQACQFLLSMGADPNSCGEFRRSPLWRAAFLGKHDVVPILLAAGADPRLENESGELPAHVAANAAIKDALAAWDVSQSDAILERWRAQRAEKVAEIAAEQASRLKTAEDEHSKALEAFQQAQRQLKHARQELEKRIFEHDTCVQEKKPDSLVQVTLQQIKDQEAALETAVKQNKEALDAYELAKFRLREHAAKDSAQDEALPGQLVRLRELDDVLIKDVGGKLKQDGRWPLVIDVTCQASVYLRYMDSNYCNALSVHNMEPDRLRKSLLGAIRYGKPLVLDLMDVDLWDEVHKIFDAIQPGLLPSIVTKQILQQERYLKLVKKSDGDEYSPNSFQDDRVAKFCFVVLTSVRKTNDRLLEQLYSIRVKVEK